MEPQTYTTQTDDKAIQLHQEKKTALDKIKAYAELDDIKKRFVNIMGDKEGRRYIEAVIIAVANSDQLQECSPKSIMIQAMRACSMKLSLDPIMEQAYLIAYKKEANLVPDYRGLVQLAVNTGYYEYAPDVHEVYQGEVVKMDRMTGKVTIDDTTRESDKVIGWAAYSKAKNGTERWLYMTNEECDAHGEKYNPGGFKSDKSPWNKERDKMRRKTCLRIFIKRYGNFSPVIQSFLVQSEVVEGISENLPSDENIVIPEKEKRTTAQNLKDLGFESDNPDPIKDKDWDAYLALCQRAEKVDVPYTVVVREKTTAADLCAEYGALLSFVNGAEFQTEFDNQDKPA